MPKNVTFQDGMFVLEDGKSVSEIPVTVTINGIPTTDVEIDVALFKTNLIDTEPNAQGVTGVIEMVDGVATFTGIEDANRWTLIDQKKVDEIKEIADKETSVEKRAFLLNELKKLAERKKENGYVTVKDGQYILHAPEHMKRGPYMLTAIATDPKAVAGIVGVTAADVPTAIATTGVRAIVPEFASIDNIGLNETALNVESSTLVIGEHVTSAGIVSNEILNMVNPLPGARDPRQPDLEYPNTEAAFDQVGAQINGVRDANGNLVSDGAAVAGWLTPLDMSNGTMDPRWNSDLKGFTIAEKADHYNQLKTDLAAAKTPDAVAKAFADNMIPTVNPDGTISVLDGTFVLQPAMRETRIQGQSSKVLTFELPEEYRIGTIGFAGLQFIDKWTILNGKEIERDKETKIILDSVFNASKRAKVRIAESIGGRYDYVAVTDRKHGHSLSFKNEMGDKSVCADIVAFDKTHVKLNVLLDTKHPGIKGTWKVTKDAHVTITARDSLGVQAGFWFQLHGH